MLAVVPTPQRMNARVSLPSINHRENGSEKLVAEAFVLL
jgi:hypothetical protein